jgi:hypothetical protein
MKVTAAFQEDTFGKNNKKVFSVQFIYQVEKTLVRRGFLWKVSSSMKI